MLQQNSEQIEVWERLKNQKKYIVNLLSQAIEKSNLNYDSQQSTVLSNDELNLIVTFILELWQEYLQMQIASNNEYFMEEYHNSIKSFVEFNEFYSSIIIQRDHRLLFEQQQVLQESHNEQIEQQEDEQKSNDLNEEYEEEVKEQRKQKIKDYVAEIEKRVDWLKNIIKQSSSAVSKEQNLNSDVSDKSLGLIEEQQRKENSLHNQEGQSSLIDSQILKQITVGDLQNVKKLLQQINQIIIENLGIQQELDDCKQEISQLQLKISEQLITNTEQQLNLKIQRYEQFFKQYFQKPQSEDESPESNDHAVLVKLRGEIQKIKQILSGDNFKQFALNYDDDQSINQILQATQKIVDNAQSINQKAINRLKELMAVQNQVENYKNFIRMAIIEKEFLPKETIILSQIQVEELWKSLNIQSKEQEAYEMIKLMKYSQNTYFIKQTSVIPELYWNNWKQNFSSSLTLIDLFFKNIIKIQKDSEEKMKNKKHPKYLMKKVTRFIEKRLQLLENVIEKKDLIQVKENMNQFLQQNQQKK